MVPTLNSICWLQGAASARMKLTTHLHPTLRLRMVELYLHFPHILMSQCLSIFFLPHCSHTWELAPASEHRAELPQFLNLGQSVGLLDRWSASCKASTCTQTQKNAHTYTNTEYPCPEWDSNRRSRFPSEDSARLRPLGYRDRLN
jgi:hypothetical protein